MLSNAFLCLQGCDIFVQMRSPKMGECFFWNDEQTVSDDRGDGWEVDPMLQEYVAIDLKWVQTGHAVMP